MKAPSSKFHKLPFCDGLEALDAMHYNISFPAHFHPTFNISLVYDGIFQTKLHSRSISAPSGSILITNPQEIHANPCDKDDRISFFTFYLSREFLSYCNKGKPVSFDQKVIYDDELFACLHNLKLALNEQAPSFDFEANIVKTLYRLASKHSIDGYEPEISIPAIFEDILNEENFEKFSLESAARRFGINKFKFLRLFKFQTGLTPNNYFILKRIEKSKIMLREGQDLLSIAIDLGFYDTAHFCNHFKKFTGISPIAYTGG